MNTNPPTTTTVSDEHIERDTALLQRIARKDTAAFHEFHRLHSGLLFATVAQVLNDQHDAEDILQDVLLMVWQKAHLYEPRKGKPLTWITTLARNRAIDRIRSRQRRSRLNEDFGNESQVAQPEFADSAVEEVEQTERSRFVRALLSQLNSDQKQAIKLAYFEGFSQADIARKLGQPIGTVKARIRRGMSVMNKLALANAALG